MKNEIIVDKKGAPTCFSGESAVDVFRIRVLVGALGLLQAGIRPSRGLTLTKALAMATGYTGVVYKRTQAEQAVEDLKKIERLRLQHIPVKKL